MVCPLHTNKNKNLLLYIFTQNLIRENTLCSEKLMHVATNRYLNFTVGNFPVKLSCGTGLRILEGFY